MEYGGLPRSRAMIGGGILPREAFHLLKCRFEKEHNDDLIPDTMSLRSITEPFSTNSDAASFLRPAMEGN